MIFMATFLRAPETSGARCVLGHPSTAAPRVNVPPVSTSGPEHRWQATAAGAVEPTSARAPVQTGRDGVDGKGGDGGSGVGQHHPSAFALPTALALTGGVLVAVAADGPAPAVALHEE